MTSTHQSITPLWNALQHLVNDYEEVCRECDESRLLSDAYIRACAVLGRNLPPSPKREPK